MKNHQLALASLIGLICAFSANRCSAQELRIATYNASLFGKSATDIRDRLGDGIDEQAENVAAVVQTVRPDILLINELDYDESGAAASLLNEKFFGHSQGSLKPHSFKHVYAVPSNTGVDSKLDLNSNDKTGEPADAWGFGRHPGQYAMAVFSKHPIDTQSIRSFQRFLWKDLPGANRPIDPKTGESYYDDETWNALRLSSKNHVDVPIDVDGTTIHVLASHPTPPVFDGPEDRNGCRNHDEILFWLEYLKGPDATTLVDDQGNRGGLAAGASFVIMGDLNADSVDGDGKRQAIIDLLSHERVQDPQPKSAGAVEDASNKKSSARQKGDPALDTAAFNGNLRVDYVLPSRTLSLKHAGVFWPTKDAKHYNIIKLSDHRMVWIDVDLAK